MIDVFHTFHQINLNSSKMAPALIDDTLEVNGEDVTVQQGLESLSLGNIPAKSSLLNQVPASNGNGATPASVPSRVKASSYPQSGLELVDRFIDEPRSLRVSVIGGGLAGILAGILLPKKVPGIQLTIYEKNNDFVSALCRSRTQVANRR